ncbi:ketopantoate reductase family protein [Desulfosporosinus sp. PR]|uniref:ketopantoate reductase family protein n=1 Tax=Candidatus Desulfosporosinus nitrosoreducens TaxID=3401928 RepID=UPI0027F4BBE9|nr:ketopantoate reductase family protein [Desulfosporosinus sp. PR]MDQ7094301.1 ketopantoate reductase family protein [Desulfosporosinus sp. PR]
MNITVIGAGAVGGYFGGRLAEAGHNLTFLVRENRAKQLADSGLVIKSPHGDLALTPHIVQNPQEIKTCDLIILSTKNYHLEGTFAQIRPLVSLGAKLLPLLNGIEHYELLAKEFGSDKVLGGLCKIFSTLDADGVIHHTDKIHEITFGALQPSQSKFCLEVKQALENSLLTITCSGNIWDDIWSKYAFITAFSAITTASRLSIDQVAENEATKEVYSHLLQEMWSLSRECGAILRDDFVPQNLNAISNYPKGSTSSMHKDFRKGLPLEVESFQGAAIRLGIKHGLELPTVRALYGLLKPFENGFLAEGE